MLVVTRIVQSKNLTQSKFRQLEEIACRLGRLRKEIWQEFGGLKSLQIKHRQIRDNWVKTRTFDVPARLWKETLRDVFQDIEMYRAAAEKKTIQDIYRNFSDKDKRRGLTNLVKNNNWLYNSYIHRRMRKNFKHGKTNVENHIVLDSHCYTWFEKDGQGWLSVMSLIPYKRLAIPLNSNVKIEGTIRIILKDASVEVHYPKEITETKSCGSEILGVDKGYTEALTDSNGQRYGLDLGELLSKESDYRKDKYQKRAKLQKIAKKSETKRLNIEKNNLGKKKLNKRKSRFESNAQDLISKAVHSVVDKAEFIICEDLTKQIKGKKYSKNQNRRMAAWTKGIIRKSLESVSQRRGASLHNVNGAYTSQVLNSCGHFGVRQGDRLYCKFCKVVVDSDINAAINILNRFYDDEIGQKDSPSKVKKVLLSRILPTDGTAHLGLQLQAKALINEERIT